MDDYIKREQALKLIESAGAWGWSNNILYDEMKNLPAADVAPVVHGKWVSEVYIDPQGGEWTKYKCNLCGNVEYKKYPYCTCGAKMDLEDDK